jgi:hypothetical protein
MQPARMAQIRRGWRLEETSHPARRDFRPTTPRATIFGVPPNNFGGHLPLFAGH